MNNTADAAAERESTRAAAEPAVADATLER